MNFERAPIKKESKGIVIELPKDEEVVKKLHAKYAEYKDRYDEFTAPEAQMDTVCKLKVLGALLEAGTVDVATVRHELEEQYGAGFNERDFINAYEVIEDYIHTGGARTFGGTGLEGNREK